MNTETEGIESIDKEFPKIGERLNAATVDGIIIVGFIILISLLFSNFEEVANSWRISAFVFVFFLYDPIFTSLFGGTLGHMMFNLSVSRLSNEKRKLSFPSAILRFIIKASLGIISLFTINNNENKMAIHDMAVGSVMVYRNTKSKA
ncbi:MAG: RDD family protein [Flavobacteriales bacterium]|nr:RDD family protein [Flavobacteriales bacterium]